MAVRKFPFGEHQGKDIREIPSRYLNWLAATNANPKYVAAAQAELDRRDCQPRDEDVEEYADEDSPNQVYDEVQSFHKRQAASSNDGDDTWRHHRLSRVLGYVCARAGYVAFDRIMVKLVGMHDHKGYLTVTWFYAPTQAEKAYFDEAWTASYIGDHCEGGIEHKTV